VIAGAVPAVAVVVVVMANAAAVAVVVVGANPAVTTAGVATKDRVKVVSKAT
jgi:hypothetical protein